MSKVKVSVLYPRSEGSTFDMDYYKVTHREIVERVLGPVEFSCEEGLPDQPFMATGHLVYDSLEAMQAGMGGAPGAAHRSWWQTASIVMPNGSRQKAAKYGGG